MGVVWNRSFIRNQYTPPTQKIFSREWEGGTLVLPPLPPQKIYAPDFTMKNYFQKNIFNQEKCLKNLIFLFSYLHLIYLKYPRPGRRLYFLHCYTYLNISYLFWKALKDFTSIIYKLKYFSRKNYAKNDKLYIFESARAKRYA